MHKLANPVYFSLTETHSQFSIDLGGIKFYSPDYCPFGGFPDYEKTAAGIQRYADLGGDFFVVGQRPFYNHSVSLINGLVCEQMLLPKPINLEIAETIVELCTPTQKSELFALVNLVQPGYFRPQTSELGKYYGIYQDNCLVAAAGERLKMNDFTEVSAVVTHPNHTGKGYAKQLITHTANGIFRENKTPYLHVAEANAAAIALYEKLGFYKTRQMHFWLFRKNKNP